MSETVTIEKKVFDVLQKNNLDLMQKVYELNKLTDELSNHLENAKETLRFYANGEHISSTSISSPYYIKIEDGTKAQECLKEIEE